MAAVDEENRGCGTWNVDGVTQTRGLTATALKQSPLTILEGLFWMAARTMGRENQLCRVIDKQPACRCQEGDRRRYMGRRGGGGVRTQ
jgi:hypothetical protein